MASVPSRRKSADERREDILAVSLEHFAVGGYHGTSTDGIAREAGISQPYLFRLFRTKKELFLACNDRACQKVLEAFRSAAERAEPGERLHAMGRAYVEDLLPDRHAVLVMIQDHVRRSYGGVVNEVMRLSGATPQEAWSFFATGMLLNVVAALDLAAIADEEPWAAAWTRAGETSEHS
jgi:AcrR family transcriptional regulator